MLHHQPKLIARVCPHTQGSAGYAPPDCSRPHAAGPRSPKGQSHQITRLINACHTKPKANQSSCWPGLGVQVQRPSCAFQHISNGACHTAPRQSIMLAPGYTRRRQASNPMRWTPGGTCSTCALRNVLKWLRDALAVQRPCSTARSVLLLVVLVLPLLLVVLVLVHLGQVDVEAVLAGVLHCTGVVLPGDGTPGTHECACGSSSKQAADRTGQAAGPSGRARQQAAQGACLFHACSSSLCFMDAWETRQRYIRYNPKL